MIYRNPDDVKINDLFKSAYHWYRSRYKGRFRIRLQLMPVDDIKEFKSYGHVNKISDVPYINHSYRETKESWMTPKNCKFKGNGRSKAKKEERIIPCPHKGNNIFENLELINDSHIEMIDETYPDCEFELAKPSITNNFMLIQNKSTNGDAVGKTSFRSMIFVTDKYIIPDEDEIQSAIENTNDLISKLNKVIEIKDTVITTLLNTIKKTNEERRRLSMRVQDMILRISHLENKPNMIIKGTQTDIIDEINISEFEDDREASHYEDDDDLYDYD